MTDQPTHDPAMLADPDYHKLQAEWEYLEDCGMERSAAGKAVRAKLDLLRNSYKLSPSEVKS